MSLARMCDCECHAFDVDCEHGMIYEFEQWATFGDKDVCQRCLEGIYCRRWIPYVRPEPPSAGSLAASIHDAYDKVILEALRTTPLFKGLASDGK